VTIRFDQDQVNTTDIILGTLCEILPPPPWNSTSGRVATASECKQTT